MFSFMSKLTGLWGTAPTSQNNTTQQTQNAATLPIETDTTKQTQIDTTPPIENNTTKQDQAVSENNFEIVDSSSAFVITDDAEMLNKVRSFINARANAYVTEHKTQHAFKSEFSDTALNKFIEAIKKVFTQRNIEFTLKNIQEFIDKDTMILYYATSSNTVDDILNHGWNKEVYKHGCNKKFNNGEYFTYTTERAVIYTDCKNDKVKCVFSLVIMPSFSGKYFNIRMEYEDIPFCNKCVYIVDNTDDENYALGMCSISTQ
jgi:hypothetical protein